MEYKYYFRLDRQTNKLYQDSQYLHSDLIISCEEDDGMPPYCIFSSIHLNPLSNPEDIWRRGLLLLSIYNGLCYLNLQPLHEVFNSHTPYSFTGLYKSENDENITPRDAYDIKISDSFNLSSLKPVRNKVNLAPKIIEEAISKQDVGNIMLQISKGLDWGNLYSILDSIQGYSNGQFDLILSGANTTRAELSTFTGTVNNFNVLGIEARHGVKNANAKQPARTMGLRESQELVLNLTKSFLKSMHGIDL